MNITLMNVEPTNLPNTDKAAAASFMRHLTGRESFEFSGYVTPRSMLVYDVKFNLPRHSYAHAYLLSCSIDTFESECGSGRHATMEPIMKKFVIGKVSIEMMGNPTTASIKASTITL